MGRYISKALITFLILSTMMTSTAVADSIPRELRQIINVRSEQVENDDISAEVEKPRDVMILKDGTELPKSYRIPGDSREWYLSQFNSGPYQNRNCGPAVITMAVNWAKPEIDKLTVRQVRDIKGISRDFSTMDVREIISENGIKVEQYDYNSEMDIINQLLENKLVVLCIKGDIVNTSNGHFVVVHGYRYYDDNLYFIINDPWTRSDREVPDRVMHEEIIEWFDAVIVVSQVETPILLH